MHVATIVVFGVTLLLMGWRPPEVVGQSTASYTLEFATSWSATTHPDSFPSNPHFSGLIGAAHSDSVAFWEPGQVASYGIERMAEGGSKTELRIEVQAAIDAGTAGSILSGGGLGTSPSQVTMEFDLTEEFPLVTLTSMLAPSPDWFVGVHGLSMRDGSGWRDSVEVDLFVYDAGTDSGTFYNDYNADTDPPEPVALLTSHPFDQTGLVGTFRFVRKPTVLDATVLLEGPYDAVTGDMTAGLGAAFPTDQPFAQSVFDGSPIEYDGADSVASVPSGAVDWLLVELRAGLDAGTLVSGGRVPAILTQTGAIVGLDGGSVAFDDVAPDAFHVVIRHRNHVPMISATAFDFRAGIVVADFATSAATAHADSGPGLTELGVDRWGLAAGDGDLDGEVAIDDFALWLVAAKTAAAGYLSADYDLDGEVEIDDFGLFLRNAKVAFESQVSE